MNNEIVQILFGLLGGLAIFIYGMNLMSEGLQKAAGEKMRSILGLLTKNPIVGVLAGALTTAVLQSSSATTIMVIGFVSASLMNLPQAISIILGANIGTTMTAQLIAFKIDDYIWPIIFVGFVLFFFIKKEKIKYVGQTVFAFGLLFLGISCMSAVMKPLASMPFFAQMIVEVADIPVLGVLVGTLMTVVVQSSSATIAVLQNMASTPGPDGIHSLIGLQGSLPILFGDNIGTTITALLATIGASQNAKRTAVAHTVFNVSGTLVFIWFVPLFARLVTFLSPKGPQLAVIARQIANAHTVFNVMNTLIWLPLIWLLVKIVMKILPDGRGGEEQSLLNPIPQYLDFKIIDQPVFSLHLATKELSRIAQITLSMIHQARQGVVKEDTAAIEKLLESENTVDLLQEDTVKYLSSICTAGELTEHQASRIAGLMHVAGDIERIGDRCTDIAAFARSKIKHGYRFSDEAIHEIEDSFMAVTRMAKDTVKALQDGDLELADDILRQEKDMNSMEKRLRRHHMQRLRSGKCSPEFTVIYTDILHNLERIGDHCTNIAQAVQADINFRHLL